MGKTTSKESDRAKELRELTKCLQCSLDLLSKYSTFSGPQAQEVRALQLPEICRELRVAIKDLQHMSPTSAAAAQSKLKLVNKFVGESDKLRKMVC